MGRKLLVLFPLPGQKKNSNEAFSKQVDKDWMPVDLYVGGSEHAVLHLLYARFWHQVMYDLEYTFQKLVNQGMILGSDGEKMSRSRGNVFNPDEIVDSNGADALRMCEMFMCPLEAVKPWQTSQVSGLTRFQNKLYNAIEMDKETIHLLHKTHAVQSQEYVSECLMRHPVGSFFNILQEAVRNGAEKVANVGFLEKSAIDCCHQA
jgi:leucyl-tRNA synthetase